MTTPYRDKHDPVCSAMYRDHTDPKHCLQCAAISRARADESKRWIDHTQPTRMKDTIPDEWDRAYQLGLQHGRTLQNEKQPNELQGDPGDLDTIYGQGFQAGREHQLQAMKDEGWIKP